MNPDLDESQEYSVEYRGNNHTSGTPPLDSKVYKKNDVITLQGQESLLKEGFIFNGWNTIENGSGTNYSENDELTIDNANVLLYARWLNEIAYNAFVPSNVSRIDILNVFLLPENEWHYASVDLINGSLTLRDGQNDSKFQFQYNAESNPPSGNHGFLNIVQNIGFRTATTDGKAHTLTQGAIIDINTFDDSNVAQVSGENNNWGDLNHVFVPVLFTIVNNTHFGYIDVSYNDVAGQLTIHATAYNRIPAKNIKAGAKGP